MSNLVIINFKETSSLKKALRIAAAKSGHDNVSKFISSVLRENQLVARELKNSSKKS